MIKLDEKTLRALQMTELELLEEVDRICKKCGIRYAVIAGTMLGAVRHGGFIPWDDDADVAMTRREYLRFRRACETELDKSRFYFQDHEVTSGYRWGYGKLRRRDSLFLREHQEHMPYDQGVFIDIFPLDEVPETLLGRTVFNAECFAVRKFLWARVGKVADKSAVKRHVYHLMDRVPEETVLSWLNRLIDRSEKLEAREDRRELKTARRGNEVGAHRSGKRGRRAEGTPERWVRILMFPTPNREYGYKRRWYTSTEPVVFEGEAFEGVTDADGYLSFKFGDYMTLPPASQRKVHPVSAIALPDEAPQKSPASGDK